MSSNASDPPWDNGKGEDKEDRWDAREDDEQPGNDRPDDLGINARYEGGVEEAVPAWLTSLHPMLPETLFAPYHPGRARYFFRKLGKSEDCGLMVFSAPEVARSYVSAFLAPCGYEELRTLSLDEARDLARACPTRINCVALIDDPHHPIVLIVR